jgi:hypothetical protein
MIAVLFSLNLLFPQLRSGFKIPLHWRGGENSKNF